MSQVTISQVMEAYASDAVTLARRGSIVLDYSEASLEKLDIVLSALAAHDSLSAGTPEAEKQAWQLSKIYGGYLGQVVIAVMGGAWVLHDQPDGSARVVLISNKIHTYPPEYVFKRLTGDAFSSVSGYCRALRTILEREKQE